MKETDRLECVMIPIRSNPEKHGEQVRMEEDVTEASRFGNEQNACKVSYGDQTDSVKTQRNETDRKSTRLNSSHAIPSRMPSSA